MRRDALPMAGFPKKVHDASLMHPTTAMRLTALRLRLGHDGTPFRPATTVAAVGDSEPHRAQARQGLRSNSPRP